MVKENWTQCSECKFPALYSEFKRCSVALLNIAHSGHWLIPRIGSVKLIQKGEGGREGGREIREHHLLLT